MIQRCLVVLVSAFVFILVTTPFSTKAADMESLYIEQGEQVTLFHPVKLAPSRVMEEKVITIKNKNDSSVEIAASFQFYLEKSELDSQKLQQMLEFYEMSAEIHLRGKVHHIEWTSLTDVNDRLQALQLNQIPSKDSLEIIYSIRLLETAHNDFQAVTLNGELLIDSLTEKSQVETIVKDKEDTKGNSLPNTATETWTFMYIGILLTIGGSALLIYYSIRVFQRKRGNVYGG
ncbi:LPXTG cell wall anchor domain-containing protein [Sutcliffiella horikoshii]|uniref:LPXTG cell wall anchor domain-containing protein n=1 Tax=Sutcliffiella horikoshii TaxID=79883 RepID=UPI00384BBE64